jgi:predicted nucleic acid-binding protein
VTLVDTSAWVEYLRASGSTAHRQLRRLMEGEMLLHTTDVVVMEVLAGGRDEAHTAQLRRLITRCEFVPTEGLADFEQAALLYRQCRRGGETVRALADCLVAAVAVRADLDVLHADRDFDVLARHTGLRLYVG